MMQFYCFELPNKPLSDKLDHPIYLYHKGNMEGVKSDILDFQLQFLTSNPYSNDVESNWSNFKQAIKNAITSHIPQKPSQSRNNLPWITPSIKRLMNCRTHLYRK